MVNCESIDGLNSFHDFHSETSLSLSALLDHGG